MRVYFVASSDTFVRPIVEALQSKGYECVLDSSFDKNTASESDVIWCEWADQNAMEVQNFIFRGKKILRIHGYEVYEQDTYRYLNPKAFDTIIFVSQEIADYYQVQIKGTLDNVVVMPNWVDSTKFTIADGKEKNNNVVATGYIGRKKGLGDMLLIATAYPNHQFHLVGSVQELDIAHYLETVDLPKNLHIHPPMSQEELNNFYADKSYYLHCGLRETFGVAIYEAMLSGLKPIVRDAVGTKQWYDEQWIWKTLEELNRMLDIDEVNPSEYREYAKNVADTEKLINSIMAVVEQPKAPKRRDTLTVGIVKTREEYLPKLMQSLKNQSCLDRYDFEVAVLDNMNKSMSIGKAYNTLADNCKTDLILYVGDDDWLDECYIDNCLSHYETRKEMYPQPVGVATNCLYIENEMGTAYPCSKMPTGFWNAEYVRGRRFNEQLPQQVDSEFVDRVRQAQEQGEPSCVIQIENEYGYYYRQHNNNVSGNKLTDDIRNGK
jgi:glycosyltransferase involved in cell wall biosynthesis